ARVLVDWTRARFQLACETRVQAWEALRQRFAQLEIGEQLPDRDRGSCKERRFDLAEPAEKPIRQLTREMVRQQKAEGLLQYSLGGGGAHCHISVRIIE